MTLDDFKTEENTKLRFKQYDYPEVDEELEVMMEGLQRKFPEPVDIDFIEVSPEITENRAKAYFRKRDGKTHVFIRIASHTLQYPEWYIRQCILHEMVHCFFYREGHSEVTDGHPAFKWVCGAVGCEINQIHTASSVWLDCMEPFIDDEELYGAES